MNSLGLGLLIGWLAGSSVAGVAAVIVTRFVGNDGQIRMPLGRHRRGADELDPVDDLTAVDRDVIANQFAAHASAAAQQVSSYADVLAGGDRLLRERLRGFEWKP